MAKKKTEREPIIIARPVDGETEDQVAERIASAVIKAVNKKRKKQGLPPLAKS